MAEFIGMNMVQECEQKKNSIITDLERKSNRMRDRVDALEEKAKKEKHFWTDKILNVKADLERTQTKAKEETKRRKAWYNF
jgi:molecular chaperone GrpE (heat shock protein)